MSYASAEKCILKTNKISISTLHDHAIANKEVQTLASAFSYDLKKVTGVSCRAGTLENAAVCTIQLNAKNLPLSELRLGVLGDFDVFISSLEPYRLRGRSIGDSRHTRSWSIPAEEIYSANSLLESLSDSHYCTSNNRLLLAETDSSFSFSILICLTLFMLFGVTCFRRKKASAPVDDLPTAQINNLVGLPALTTSARQRNNKTTMPRLKKTTLPRGNHSTLPRLTKNKVVKKTNETLPRLKKTTISRVKKSSAHSFGVSAGAMIKRTYTGGPNVELMKNLSDQSLIRYSVNSISTIHSLKSTITKEDTARFSQIKHISKAFSQNLSVISSAFKDQLSTLMDITLYNTTEEIMINFVNEVNPYVLALIKERNIDSIDLGKFRSFYLYDEPEIPVKNYLQSMLISLEQWYSEETLYSYETAPRSLLMAIVYLERLEATNACVEITRFNIHVILAILILVATKFMEDEVITNDYWGRTCGLSLEEVNDLEEIICFEMNFNFNVQLSEISNLIEKIQVQNIQNRT